MSAWMALNKPLVGVIYDPCMEAHIGPDDHHEKPARTAALFSQLQEDNLLSKCVRLTSRKATDAEILRGHSDEHILKIEQSYLEDIQASDDGILELDEGDLFLCSSTTHAARIASGCCIEAVLQVARKEIERAMAIVRPPGHHAECSCAMGFCFYNNVALAALAALQQPGVERVAVLDWDVHHGNGTQKILAANDNALYISIHRKEKDFFPESGAHDEVGDGNGQGYTINIPWSREGKGDLDYMAAFSLIVEPVLKTYQPDLIIVSAGFDAARGDPLGECNVSPAGFAHMTEQLLQYADGRVILALEGGYNVEMTAACGSACMKVLLGEKAPAIRERRDGRFLRSTRLDLEKVVQVHQRYWPLLNAWTFDKDWKKWIKTGTGPGPKAPLTAVKRVPAPTSPQREVKNGKAKSGDNAAAASARVDSDQDANATSEKDAKAADQEETSPGVPEKMRRKLRKETKNTSDLKAADSIPWRHMVAPPDPTDPIPTQSSSDMSEQGPEHTQALKTHLPSNASIHGSEQTPVAMATGADKESAQSDAKGECCQGAGTCKGAGTAGRVSIWDADEHDSGDDVKEDSEEVKLEGKDVLDDVKVAVTEDRKECVEVYGGDTKRLKGAGWDATKNLQLVTKAGQIVSGVKCSKAEEEDEKPGVLYVPGSVKKERREKDEKFDVLHAPGSVKSERREKDEKLDVLHVPVGLKPEKVEEPVKKYVIKLSGSAAKLARPDQTNSTCRSSSPDQETLSCKSDGVKEEGGAEGKTEEQALKLSVHAQPKEDKRAVDVAGAAGTLVRTESTEHADKTKRERKNGEGNQAEARDLSEQQDEQNQREQTAAQAEGDTVGAVTGPADVAGGNVAAGGEPPAPVANSIIPQLLAISEPLHALVQSAQGKGKVTSAQSAQGCSVAASTDAGPPNTAPLDKQQEAWKCSLSAGPSQEALGLVNGVKFRELKTSVSEIHSTSSKGGGTHCTSSKHEGRRVSGGGSGSAGRKGRVADAGAVSGSTTTTDGDCVMEVVTTLLQPPKKRRRAALTSPGKVDTTAQPSSAKSPPKGGRGAPTLATRQDGGSIQAQEGLRVGGDGAVLGARKVDGMEVDTAWPTAGGPTDGAGSARGKVVDGGEGPGVVGPSPRKKKTSGYEQIAVEMPRLLSHSAQVRQSNESNVVGSSPRKQKTASCEETVVDMSRLHSLSKEGRQSNASMGGGTGDGVAGQVGAVGVCKKKKTAADVGTGEAGTGNLVHVNEPLAVELPASNDGSSLIVGQKKKRKKKTDVTPGVDGDGVQKQKRRRRAGENISTGVLSPSRSTGVGAQQRSGNPAGIAAATAQQSAGGDRADDGAVDEDGVNERAAKGGGMDGGGGDDDDDEWPDFDPYSCDFEDDPADWPEEEREALFRKYPPPPDPYAKQSKLQQELMDLKQQVMKTKEEVERMNRQRATSTAVREIVIPYSVVLHDVDGDDAERRRRCPLTQHTHPGNPGNRAVAGLAGGNTTSSSPAAEQQLTADAACSRAATLNHDRDGTLTHKDVTKEGGKTLGAGSVASMTTNTKTTDPPSASSGAIPAAPSIDNLSVGEGVKAQPGVGAAPIGITTVGAGRGARADTNRGDSSGTESGGAHKPPRHTGLHTCAAGQAGAPVSGRQLGGIGPDKVLDVSVLARTANDLVRERNDPMSASRPDGTTKANTSAGGRMHESSGAGLIRFASGEVRTSTGLSSAGPDSSAPTPLVRADSAPITASLGSGSEGVGSVVPHSAAPPIGLNLAAPMKDNLSAGAADSSHQLRTYLPARILHKKRSSSSSGEASGTAAGTPAPARQRSIVFNLDSPAASPSKSAAKVGNGSSRSPAKAIRSGAPPKPSSKPTPIVFNPARFPSKAFLTAPRPSTPASDAANPNTASSTLSSSQVLSKQSSTSVLPLPAVTPQPGGNTVPNKVGASGGPKLLSKKKAKTEGMSLRVQIGDSGHSQIELVKPGLGTGALSVAPRSKQEAQSTASKNGADAGKSASGSHGGQSRDQTQPASSGFLSSTHSDADKWVLKVDQHSRDAADLNTSSKDGVSCAEGHVSTSDSGKIEGPAPATGALLQSVGDKLQVAGTTGVLRKESGNGAETKSRSGNALGAKTAGQLSYKPGLTSPTHRMLDLSEDRVKKPGGTAGAVDVSDSSRSVVVKPNGRRRESNQGPASLSHVGKPHGSSGASLMSPTGSGRALDLSSPVEPLHMQGGKQQSAGAVESSSLWAGNTGVVSKRPGDHVARGPSAQLKRKKSDTGSTLTDSRSSVKETSYSAVLAPSDLQYHASVGGMVGHKRSGGLDARTKVTVDTNTLMSPGSDAITPVITPVHISLEQALNACMAMSGKSGAEGHAGLAQQAQHSMVGASSPGGRGNSAPKDRGSGYQRERASGGLNHLHLSTIGLQNLEHGREHSREQNKVYVLTSDAALD